MSEGTEKRRVGREPIDVLIPAVEKDAGTLPHVIDAVRKHVLHPIGSIYIVAPENETIRNVCHEKDCRFVNERSVLPITKDDISYRTGQWNRAGWLYQQLLKLSGDTVCRRRFFLVIDADTVLIRPHVFKLHKKTVFYYRRWSQPEYFRSYLKVMGRKASAPVSLVAHYMLFDRKMLRRLKRRIAVRHGTSWYSAILGSINPSKQFAFSEYETYGNFVHTYFPGRSKYVRALNRSMRGSMSDVPAARLRELATRFRSISFHKRRDYYIHAESV